MFRPGFPPRMPPMGVLPQVPRPPIPGVRPMVTPVVRPLVPIVAPSEKPQTTVYVGKIAPTVDNEFLLSLLKLCGPVKSWKRAQDPSDGTPKGFGFCEFEAAEGILRAMRLMSKLSIDGQELVEEADKIKAAGKAWYKTMISDSDYTEFDIEVAWCILVSTCGQLDLLLSV